MRTQVAVLAMAVFALPLLAPLHAQVTTVITTDPPPNKTHPATMDAFPLPSHGSALNALFYEAAGSGMHPTVLLLHGFPGNEKNLDVAQAMRRDGWNVLYIDYRGSWGTPGTFSFEHSIEDAQAALAYLRDPANAARLHVDSHELVVAGHSMGGMIALFLGAGDPKLAGVAAWSAADMAGRAQPPADSSPEAKAQMQTRLAGALEKEGMAPLSGCTPEGLAAELMAHPEWALLKDAPGLAKKPVLLITSDDGGAPPVEKLAAAIGAAGGQELKIVHFATDHSYSDKRIALTAEVLSGLEYLQTH